MPSLNTGNQSADRAAAAAEAGPDCFLEMFEVPAAFDHMEEGELSRGVDGEGGVRSREADLRPLLPHHRWKQLPHLRT